MENTLKKSDLSHLLEASIDFNFHSGQVQDCKPHNDTGWRVLSFFVIINVQGGYFYCDLEENKRINIPKGQTLLLPPGLPHLLGMDKKGGILRWAHVHTSIMGSLELSSLYHFPLMVDGLLSENIGNSIENIHNISQAKKEDNIQLLVDLKIAHFELLKALLQSGQKSEGYTGFLFKTKRLMPVLNYVQSNLQNKIDRGELARLMALSEPQFHTVFKDIMGIAPMEYVKKVKLKKAQEYLSLTQYSIKEISRMLGYYDEFHFSKQFKKSFDVSPRAFQKEVGKFLPENK